MVDELLREIARLGNSAQKLAVEIKQAYPRAGEQALNVCLEIQRLFSIVYDGKGGAYNG